MYNSISSYFFWVGDRDSSAIVPAVADSSAVKDSLWTLNHFPLHTVTLFNGYPLVQAGPNCGHEGLRQHQERQQNKIEAHRLAMEFRVPERVFNCALHRDDIWLIQSMYRLKTFKFKMVWREDYLFQAIMNN